MTRFYLTRPDLTRQEKRRTLAVKYRRRVRDALAKTAEMITLIDRAASHPDSVHKFRDLEHAKGLGEVARTQGPFVPVMGVGVLERETGCDVLVVLVPGANSARATFR
jgi:hypothetical protein